jgi:hypothetical protein
MRNSSAAAHYQIRGLLVAYSNDMGQGSDALARHAADLDGDNLDGFD